MRWGPRLPRSRRGRQALAAGVATVLAVGVAAALWRYRDAMLERMVERRIPVELTISGFRPGNPMRLDFVGLRDPEDRHAPSLLGAEDVTIGLSPGDDRQVDYLAAARATLNIAGVPERNYDFLLHLLQSPRNTGPDPAGYAPRRVDVQALTLGIESLNAGMRLEGVSVQGEMASLDEMHWQVSGQQVSGFWRVDAASSEKQNISGSLELNAELESGEWRTQAEIELPGLASLAAQAIVTTSPVITAQVALQPGRLESPLWAQMLSDRLGYPVYFDSATITGGSMQLASSAGRLHSPAMSLVISTDTLRLGPENATQYEGPLAIEVSGGSEEGVAGRAKITLGDRAPIDATLASSPEGLRVEVSDTRWGREEITTLLPESARDYLEFWPALSAATLSGALSLRAEATYVDATLKHFSGQNTTIEMHGTRSTNGTMQADVEGAGDGIGNWTATLTDIGQPQWDAVVHLGEAQMRAWMQDVFGHPWPEAADVTLTGDIAYAAHAEAPAEMSAKLAGEWRATKVLHIEADLKGQHRSEKQDISGISGRLDAGALGKWTVSGGRWGLSDRSLQLTAKGPIDVAAIAQHFGAEGMAGKAEVNGRVLYDANGLRMEQASATLHGAALAGLALPVDPPLRLDGGIGLLPGGGASATISGQWGEGLSFTIDALRFISTRDWNAAAMSLSGPLSSLVDTGHLKEASGTLDLSGEQVGTNGSGSLRWKLDGNLVLPEDLLAARGLLWEAQGTYTSTVSATGPLAVAELAALGVTLTDTACTARVEGTQVFFDNLTCGILGGKASGTASTDYSQSPPPFHLDVQVTGIDLASFTTTFQPPNVELTGLVNGRISASIQGEQITALDVELESGEGFTLNRGMVAQILMQQQVGEFSGSGTVSKIVDRVVGDAEKRPFTAAQLNLGLDGGRISGDAILNSDALNLTVDIRADQGALFEAIRMRQEGQVASFTTTFE